MKKTFLAFDLGASSGRGILGTLENGKLDLEEVHRFENGPIELKGSLHWDINAIFAEIKTGLKKAVEKCDDIAGIAVDTWGVDYVLLKEDGEFARLPYHYRDSRTDGILDSFFADSMTEEEVYASTGIQKMFFNTLPQLIAHSRDHAEDFAGAKIMLMPDALTYLLCGKVACEYTDASTTQLLDAEKRSWDFDLIEKAGIPKELFPEIVSPCTQTGVVQQSLQDELGCGAIPVLRVGSHDTASAVGAVPASVETNWAYISCGTWALIGAEIDSPILSSEAMKAGYTNEGGLNNKIRLLTNINGTWLLQEVRRNWKEAGRDISFMEMENMAADAEGKKFIINPNDDRFMAPGDMASRIREYCVETGQGEIPDDAALIRCIYDSLADCFSEKLHELEKLQNVKYDCLHIVGGATKARLLMQLTADAIKIPVIAGPVEATAIGNIIAQGIASGAIANLAEGREVVKNSFPMDEFKVDA